MKYVTILNFQWLEMKDNENCEKPVSCMFMTHMPRRVKSWRCQNKHATTGLELQSTLLILFCGSKWR